MTAFERLQEARDEALAKARARAARENIRRMTRPGKRRFFFHYRKQDGRMSVHFQGQCIPCIDVVCRVPCVTKRNKRQPFLVMQGFARRVLVEGPRVIID